jgi:cytochrome c6
MKLNIKQFYSNVFFLISFFFSVSEKTLGRELNEKSGQQIFISNCNVCHQNGNNIIIPEKSLRLENLKANGMENIEAIIYQVTNGKNGMPAFGGRLKEKDIEKVAQYILEKTNTNFEK